MVAVATKYLPAREGDYQRADESDLILEGYIAFLDPPKETTRPGAEGAEGQRHHGEDPHRRQRAGGG
ncbi:magnesium-transporting ATPase MgtA [Klebsiella pneumoniae]|uniref:Magnesium-transporting ATPase MgtA n=1 Tax=Klebsiella pneumoniae TaxID=573 RepID=A0A447RY14_KLEPN|nr:magnesium-transporting ATPase MgtA [Klebsiella pneumoniae]